MRSGAALPLVAGLDVLEEIGRGNHAVVYRARKGDRDLVLKLQRDPHPGQAARARREAAVLACMRHPALPQILDVGALDDRPWLVMDYAPGRTLAQVLAHGPLRETQIVRIASDLAGALAEVHGRGLVHRDVKPDNVLIAPDGSARLLDFGLAMRVAGGSAGEVAGTFRYAAPEQTGMLERPVDGRSDLYALGGLLFECAAGRPPFEATEVAELVREHAVRPAPDLLRLRPELSPAFAAIVARLLAKDPDDRYQSGKGLVADLQSIEDLRRRGAAVVLGARDAPQALFEAEVVGREREIALLESCWSGARDGHGTAVLLEGPAGYGKSRLLRDLAERARDRGGCLVLQARCASGDPTPFGALRVAIEAWLHRLRRLPEGVRAEEQRRLAEVAGNLAPLLRHVSPSLAAMLPVADGGESDHARVCRAAAHFLAALAHAHGALLLVLDDVEWLDDASRLVLEHLALLLPSTPLLLAAAGSRAEPGLAGFTAALGDHLAYDLPLRELDDEAGRALMSQHLGGGEVPDELARAVAARAQGVPFAIVEYLGAMVEAGLLTPAWGGWRVDSAGLERLQLPADVAALLARRVEALSAASLPVLQTAAVWGSGVTPAGLAATSRRTADEVEAAIAEAIRAHLVERTPRGGLAFVHERVRGALLARLRETERAALHRAIAAWLEARADVVEPEVVYALARHLALGDGEPLRIHDANLKAGKLALQAFANEDALAFLENAGMAAARAGVGAGAELEEALGVASARAGHYPDAIDHLARAARKATGRLARARVLGQLAEVHLALLDTAAGWRAIEAGFRALRTPYPTGSIGSWFISIVLAAIGTLLHIIGLGGDATGKSREKHAIRARLSNLGNRLGHLEAKTSLLVQMTIVPLYSVHRLGRSHELAGAWAAQAVMLARFGEKRLSKWLARRAHGLAESLQDRALAARVLVLAGVATHMRGGCVEAETIHRANLEENTGWLDAGDFHLASSDLAANLLLRGHARGAWQVIERALVRAQRHEIARSRTLKSAAAASLAMLGRVDESAAWLRRAQRLEESSDRWSEAALLESRLLLLLEESELDGRLEEAISAYARLGFAPWSAPHHRRIFWVLQARARLAQLQRGLCEQGAVQSALAELRVAANTPALHGHVLLVEAGLAAWRGDRADAMRRLDEAEALGRELDAPWLRCDALAQRAALLPREQAQREARLAHALALDLGWAARARRIARRHQIEIATTPAENASRSERGSATQLKMERQLGALLQVSRACASVLHPDRVAEVALDEIVLIFAAERALLFLGSPGGVLERRTARGAPGRAGPIPLEDYSRTVVQRVWATRQPLLVSSVEEEASLEAQSVVVHELRSILAVPLVIRDEAIGVLYVDNRLARGAFGRDDVQILAALATQIGTAIETARTVQLEIERKALASDLEKAYEQATTDALTGLHNRRYFDERLEVELARAQRSGKPLSLLMVDVDRFKGVNDTYGHLAGDRVLAAVGDVLEATVRTTDLAARFGGEEFCVLLPDTDAEGAAQLAERVRKALASHEMPVEGGVLRVTASLGVATWGVNGTCRETLIAAADQALYAAKEGGRNQVRVAAA